MILNIEKDGLHFVTPLNERAAKFLNTFAGRTLVMTPKMFQSMLLECNAHNCIVL